MFFDRTLLCMHSESIREGARRVADILSEGITSLLVAGILVNGTALL